MDLGSTLIEFYFFQFDNSGASFESLGDLIRT